MTTPAGVIAIFTSPEGDVIASESDFEQSSHAGFRLIEAQRMRANRALDWAVIRAYCSERIQPAISDHYAHEIVRNLERKGWKRTIIPVGHPTV